MLNYRLRRPSVLGTGGVARGLWVGFGESGWVRRLGVLGRGVTVLLTFRVRGEGSL